MVLNANSEYSLWTLGQSVSDTLTRKPIIWLAFLGGLGPVSVIVDT